MTNWGCTDTLIKKDFIHTYPVGAPPVEKNSFQLFPNPSNGTIFIESEKPIKSLVVYDAVGQLVWKQSGIHQNKMTVEKLDAGLYFIKIVFANGPGEMAKVLVE